MMKKFFISFLVALLLLFNNSITSLAVGNVFKEGFYTPAALNMPSKGDYTIQNVSSTSNVYLLVFDQTNSLYQSVRMEPGSSKYVITVDPNFKIAIVGKGDVFVS